MQLDEKKQQSTSDFGSNCYLFVSLSDTPWFGTWYVRQKLMTEFAKEHKVIYANSRIDARLLWKRFREGRIGNNIRLLHKNLIILNSLFIFPKLYRWKRLDRIIEYLYCSFLKSIAAVYGRNRKKVLYIWEPKFSAFRKHFKNYIIVYHSYDAMHKYVYQSDTGNESLTRQHEIAEKDLVTNSTLFYAVSPNLCNYFENEYKRRPRLMINGVSENYFSLDDPNKAEKADSILSNFSVGKRLCFLGSIIGALNLDIVIESSKNLPEYQFIFVGDVYYQNDSVLDMKITKLLQRNNVFQIGPFQTDLLPYILQRMNIFLLLYDCSDQIWTYYSSPAKLFEYMALGKPIISTPHPFIQEYSELVHIAANVEEFCNLVHDISENHYDIKQKLRMYDVAQKQLWSNKKNLILKHLNETAISR